MFHTSFLLSAKAAWKRSETIRPDMSRGGLQNNLNCVTRDLYDERYKDDTEFAVTRNPFGWLAMLRLLLIV